MRYITFYTPSVLELEGVLRAAECSWAQDMRTPLSRLQQLVRCTERWMWPLCSCLQVRPAAMLRACAASPAGQEGFHRQSGASTHVSTDKQAESLVPFLLSSWSGLKFTTENKHTFTLQISEQNNVYRFLRYQHGLYVQLSSQAWTSGPLPSHWLRPWALPEMGLLLPAGYSSLKIASKVHRNKFVREI